MDSIKSSDIISNINVVESNKSIFTLDNGINVDLLKCSSSIFNLDNNKNDLTTNQNNLTTNQNNLTIDNSNKDILSNIPNVFTIDDFISDEECDHMINISKPTMKDSLVSESKEGRKSTGRTSKNTWISHNYDDITKNIGERISKIVNIPLENAEQYQVIYYNEGGEYRNHYDSWDHNGSEKTLRCMKWGGARIKTALVYLNDVEEGGSTNLPRLNVDVKAKKGRLLVFENTYPGTNVRHPLSEHAGMPVIHGEKFAFNLWFKECSTKTLYSDFNPDYYNNIPQNVIPQNVIPQNVIPQNVIPQNIISNETNNIQQLNTIDTSHNMMNISRKKNIFSIQSLMNDNDIQNILNNCNFNNNVRRDSWVKLSTCSNIINKIESVIKINRKFYENINVIEYKENIIHNKHLNAYDINSEKGKQYTAKLGQRMYTLSLILSDNINIKFPDITESYTLKKGDIMFYKNTIDNSNERDNELNRIIVSTSNTGYLANIYVREKDVNSNSIINNNDMINLIQNAIKNNTSNTREDVSLKVTELENYTNTLNDVCNLFKKNAISPIWTGLNSFKYNFKGDFNYFKECIISFNNIRELSSNKSSLNDHLLDISYNFDHNLPIQTVNNVLKNETLKIFQEYYKNTISKNVWPLGDKQSNRYKSHNEPLSRFLHYEILPLIEHIVGKRLKPTYTYLSAYIKDADLPPHTDRADCEYTVSFIVDKPENSNWNIYVHKIKQPVKHKGRYNFTPPLDECEPVDCEAGGLMIFQGTDRIHFRENLEYEYYNILLLHYCSE